MLYKEMLAARTKFGLLMVLYVSAALFVAVFAAPSLEPLPPQLIQTFDPSSELSNVPVSEEWVTQVWVVPQSIFGRWIDLTLLLTLFSVVLLGANLIAGEEERSTIGFLLARPVSRSRIFLTKLAVSIGAFVIPLLSGALVARFADRDNSTISAEQSMAWLSLVVAFGLVGICVAALISALTPSLQRAYGLSLLANTICVAALGYWYPQTAFWSPPTYVAEEPHPYITLPVLVLSDSWMSLLQWLNQVQPTLLPLCVFVAIGCATIGLRVFGRKAY